MTDSLIRAQTQGRITLPGSDEALSVPSGQAVILHDVIVDQSAADTAVYRFRFIAPAIARAGGSMNFEGSIADMQYLCDSHALLLIKPPMPTAAQIIVAFSDIVLPFGETNPDATQFFMAFTVEDGLCELEPY